ncbi:hypothetical protein ACFYYB_34625 [Streptomyces sp. NPDC002886]|uniref:hypothetical protein n=1 Tax=Streptomyces sp. NPDC002886 TaxID=3364667 RepID=UPI0036BCF890
MEQKDCGSGAPRPMAEDEKADVLREAIDVFLAEADTEGADLDPDDLPGVTDGKPSPPGQGKGGPLRADPPRCVRAVNEPSEGSHSAGSLSDLLLLEGAETAISVSGLF